MVILQGAGCGIGRSCLLAWGWKGGDRKDLAVKYFLNMLIIMSLVFRNAEQPRRPLKTMGAQHFRKS